MKRLVIFLSVLFFADYFIGLGLYYLYFHPKAKAPNEVLYAVEKAHEQILIYGSSVASNHFMPSVISDKTGFTCYNAGLAGESILYVNAINKCIVNRYSPFLIILNLDGTLYDTKSLERLSVLLPFYKRYPEIRSILKTRSTTEKIKLLSKTYPFNSQLYMIGRQFFGTPRDTIKNGFIPLNGDLRINYEALAKDMATTARVEPVKKQAFNELISLCKQKRINLVVTITPVYDTALIGNKLFLYADSLALCNNIRLLNFSEHPDFFKNDSLFIDHIHLNQRGADIFSRMIADSISSYFECRN